MSLVSSVSVAVPGEAFATAATTLHPPGANVLRIGVLVASCGVEGFSQIRLSLLHGLRFVTLSHSGPVRGCVDLLNNAFVEFE